MRKIIVLIFSFFLLISLSFSQDLVEIAKKEKERRAKLKGKKAIVVTNHNLYKYKGRESIITKTTNLSQVPSIITSEPSPTQPQPSISEGALSLSEIDKEEVFWKEKKKEYEQRLAKAKEYVDLLTTKMNGLWQEFYSLDDMTTRDKIQREISETYQKLLKAKEELAKAEKDLEEFLKEARKQGALPGWLR